MSDRRFVVTLITTATVDEVAEVIASTGLNPDTDGELNFRLTAADITSANNVLCVDVDRESNFAIGVFEFHTDSQENIETVYIILSTMFDGSIVFYGEFKPPSLAPIPTTV